MKCIFIFTDNTVLGRIVDAFPLSMMSIVHWECLTNKP